jgi:nucleoside 2-deoxyribosyltransferase
VLAAKNKLYRPERVDADYSGKLIYNKIKQNIEKAEIIVADLTFERPNCYYEVGYAHAMDKTVILTARVGTRLHFDLGGHQVIFYDSFTKLQTELEEAITKLETVKKSR